ncbi:uncharacterized protein PAC_18119 [Phialocephala subalpina]|uniref:Heterokaryon incompatibility domain-containing protein n=1 Tax=Phialocephala subalpina TaxID=576137 RepID=A0A1L7XT63_9HELO|nr:uncharacterized protein PAC_18119 [Phialocephala subalpina]
MMASIYHYAKNVNIWLGTATNDSAMGIEILSYLATNNDAASTPPRVSYPQCLVRAGLSCIMNRDWFRRIWVVQEAAVSKKATMICGHHQFSWTNNYLLVRRIERMVKFAEISPQWEQAGLGTVDMSPLLDLLDLQIGQHMDRLHGSSHRPSRDLLDVAHGLREKASTDPRDKIFSVVGCAISPEVDDFVVDYNMTVMETYNHLRDVVQLSYQISDRLSH